MSIIRLIHIKIDPTEMETALQVWKTECAPLMIQQKGCISEKLLRCREADGLISYSGTPKPTSSSTATATLTRRSCGTRERLKGRRLK